MSSISCHLLLQYFFESVMTIFYLQLYNSCWYSICYGFPLPNLLHTLIQLSCSLLMESGASKYKKALWIHPWDGNFCLWMTYSSFPSFHQRPWITLNHRDRGFSGFVSFVIVFRLSAAYSTYWLLGNWMSFFFGGGADVMKDLEVLIFRLPKWHDDN